MKLRLDELLDSLFGILVFSIIVLPASTVGKAIQAFSILVIFLFTHKKFRFCFFNFLEFLFVAYAFFQVFFGIAIIKSGTLGVANSLFYNALYTLAIFNYCMYKNDLKKVSYVYAISTIVSLFVLFIFYNATLSDFRFTAGSVISIFGVKLIGGHSSTALAMICTLPAFFINLFSDETNNRKTMLMTVILLLFSIITGTRKTLIVFAYILFIMIPLRKEKFSIFAVSKVLFISSVVVAISLFLVLNVKPLYKTVGNRIESAISVLIEGEDNTLDASIRVRERLINRSKELFNQKKIWGWGMDYFRSNNESGIGIYSHNNFMEILVGGGIIGFIIYYSKYLLLFIMMIKLKKKDEKNQTMWFSMIIFLLLIVALEYWQVTYIYRYIIIYQILIMSQIYNAKTKLKIK